MVDEGLEGGAAQVGTVRVPRLDAEELTNLHRTLLPHLVCEDGVNIFEGHPGFCERLAGRDGHHRELGVIRYVAKRSLGHPPPPRLAPAGSPLRRNARSVSSQVHTLPQRNTNWRSAASCKTSSRSAVASSTMTAPNPRSTASRAVRSTHALVATPTTMTVRTRRLSSVRSSAVDVNALRDVLVTTSSPSTGARSGRIRCSKVSLWKKPGDELGRLWRRKAASGPTKSAPS